MPIDDKKVVSLHYILRTENGDLLDSSLERDEPLVYLHGAAGIVPGLERALAGKSEGETLETLLTPDEGFGPHHPQLVQQVPMSIFDTMERVYEGMVFRAKFNGKKQRMVVVKMENDQVTVDANHPLAGVSLRYNVEILEVRDATEEELAKGEPLQPATN